MPGKRTVKRTATPPLQPAVEEYLMNRSMRERAEFYEARLKRDFLAFLEAQGELQPDGHRVLMFDEPLSFMRYKGGKPIDQEVYGLQRQRRVSQPLNEDKALALLREKNLLETCTTTVVMLDEDAILAANFTGDITDDELAGIYDTTESFAFYLITEEP